VEKLVSFWRARRVFITGHTGFKGGWLSLWLQSLGADVTGYALDPPSTPSLFEAARVGDGITSVIGNLDDRPALRRALAQARPEIVFHLAAQPLVHAGYDDPVETYRTNVLGTVHLLDALRRMQGVHAVVNVTTDKCYENRDWPWGYRETDALGGFDPYSSSKACSELATDSFRSAFFPPHRYSDHGVALATARAGNVLGGGDWGRDRLVPDVIRAINDGQAVRIRRPDAIRPWQHVLEPISGYMTLAERLCLDGPSFTGGWNFGPVDADAQPVRWIVENLVQLWGPPAHWELDTRSHPHEARFLRLDCSKAAAELGWRPRLRLAQGLEWLVEWHRAHAAGADVRALCLDQIARFEALPR
jgi:CDP-glucose 4,6-dehydratase